MIVDDPFTSHSSRWTSRGISHQYLVSVSVNTHSADLSVDPLYIVSITLKRLAQGMSAEVKDGPHMARG